MFIIIIISLLEVVVFLTKLSDVDILYSFIFKPR